MIQFEVEDNLVIPSYHQIQKQKLENYAEEKLLIMNV